MTKTRVLLFLLAAVMMFSCASVSRAEEETTIQPIMPENDNTYLYEGIDLAQYDYDQLLLLKQAVESRLADLDRQIALENADRLITFELPEISFFTHRTIFQNPIVTFLKDTAPARTAFIWSSSDTEVAQVNDNGRVTGISRGVATITAAAKDNTYLTGSFVVKVLIPLEKLTVWGESDTLLLNADSSLSETFLSVIAEPEDAYIPPIVWSSSNPEIASVDTDGKVYGCSAGKTTIIASVAEDPDLGIRSRQVSYDINVIQPATGINLDSQNLVLSVGQTYSMSAAVLPETASNKKLSWTSSNDEVIKVDDTGKLTAEGGGEADITVTTLDGSELSALCHVVVTQPVAVINITEPEERFLTLSTGNIRKIAVQVLPEDATNQELVWTSSNVFVAQVADGSIEAVGAGDCIITCAALDGSGISAQLEVHVPSFLVDGDAFTVTEKAGITIPVMYSSEINELELQTTGNAFTASLDEAKNLVIYPENAGEGTVILNNPAAPADQTEIKVSIDNSAVYNEISYPVIVYADIVRNPFAYINTPMSISGKILQIQDANESVLTLTIGTAGNDYSDQVLWAKVPVNILHKEELNDSEQITLYGTFQMEQLYSESLQSNTLIPAIVAEKVKISP
ncbi:MAG: Ig-like domain-containing protein [Clostridia bacterium]|nr:Ig-like domain-containing protein [Clostridia bacterium]